MRIAYADPPYPGMSDLYKDHPDYDGEVDHAALVRRLEEEYDAWVLHTASTTLAPVLALCPEGVRVGAWVKSFAAFKRNVRVAYAWEPVLFSPGRSRMAHLPTVVDWIMEPMTLRRGLTGAKPEAVVRWALEIVGAEPSDELDDLFPGTGAVRLAWEAWRAAPALPRLDYSGQGARAEATIPLDGEIS